MTAKQKNIPALRFPEFQREWTLEKIEDKIKFLSGFAFKGEDITDDNTGQLLMRGVNITEGYIRHSEDIDKYYCGDTEKLDKYRLKVGEIVIGMDGSKVGRNSALISEKEKDALLVQRVCSISAKKGYSTNFIYQHINSNKFHAYVDVVKTSSGIPHISATHIKEFVIGFPNLPEQQKIASFLTAVDDKIQQLTKKKALQEQYKKGIMQKLFSQELRFKDDDGNDYPDWEEKRLDHFAPLQRGFDLPMQNINAGQYPVVFSNGILKNHSEFKVKGPGVVTGRSGTIGKLTYVEQDFWPHNTTLWVTDFIDSLPKFVYYFYLNMKLYRFSTGSTVPTLNRNDIHSQIDFIPCFKEQMKIASFLTRIDDKTTVLQVQIQQTQEFKKGLLQQMFV